MKRIPLVAVAALAALLTLGTVAAAAHDGGRGDRGGKDGVRGASTSALVTEAAKQLSVTRAALVAAIQKSAKAKVDEAVEDEDIDAARAATVKEEVDDNLSFAHRLSRASGVAANLGITTTKLNAEFREARQALVTARIDKAVADGDLTAAEAAERKAKLADATVPGYKGRAFGGKHRR